MLGGGGGAPDRTRGSPSARTVYSREESQWCLAGAIRLLWSLRRTLFAQITFPWENRIQNYKGKYALFAVLTFGGRILKNQMEIRKLHNFFPAN